LILSHKSQTDPVMSLTNAMSNLTIADEKAVVALKENRAQLPSPLNTLDVFLKERKGLLAGSYLFQFVMDPKFEPNDIDLFFEHKQHNVYVGQEPRNLGPLLETMGWIYVPSKRERADYIQNTGAINQFTMKHPNSPLNINIIEYENCPTQELLAARIDEYFDLDGCTLKWDGGHQLKVAPDVNWNDFTIKRILNVRENQVEARIPKTLDDKYHPDALRGSEYRTSLDVIRREIKDTFLARMAKYEARGFKIANADVVRALCI